MRKPEPPGVDPAPVAEITGDNKNQAGNDERNDAYVQREHGVR